MWSELSGIAFASLRLYAIWGHSFKIGALVLVLHIVPLTLDEVRSGTTPQNQTALNLRSTQFYQFRYIKAEAVPGVPGCFMLTSAGYFL